ncbi:MAG: ABC transporter permease subunit [Hamadaea sp.]|uniref:ABC transporter permease subunit n=1 Tax=Hamadaea sp. TaxID=2024425 RepID=UPI0018182F7B|nr:ABC transporter permease subunit [Hamadaea sp.]NUR70437.1 ABC transporter permease subunit [Hamadaea sp.]NUT20027.1 ABC transporter permease subunit [Hamadaea sp.]
MSYLRAEWTKFRTVRGWVLAMIVASAAIVGLGIMPGMQGTCGDDCGLPTGPGGEEVTDAFTFLHQSLTGDGTITAQLTSLTGILPADPDPSAEESRGTGPSAANGTASGRPGLVPWAKAGILLKDGTRPGSAYAAVMLTGAHGVRLQYDYTHDLAGPKATQPQWLRLTRTGDAVKAEVSADGSTWDTVGTAELTGLPATVEIGLFATSPQYSAATSGAFGISGAFGGPTQATGVFENVSVTGTATGSWHGEKVGGADDVASGTSQENARFTVTGSGDIAPAVAGASGLGVTITQTLVGSFAGLIVVVVVGTMFITAEYRRGLVRTTMAANPRRGRVLAAKAVVIGAVTFVTSLPGVAAVVLIGQKVLRANGVYVHAVSAAIETQVIVGTAAVLAVSAVLAMALGMIVRHSAAAVTTAIVSIVLPYLLAMTVLPAGAGQWLLRLTPAAAFAVQQSTPEYAQVDNIYTPINGYFPLPPWAGFAVLCGWAAIALAAATLLVRRRDV